MQPEREQLQQWLDEAENTVFFSGMGVSMDSGVPDFRRMDSAHMQTYGYPPEALLSRAFYERRPGPFFRWYRDKVLTPLLTAEPNSTHHKLLELEHAGRLRMILTANMDNLHQDAGSKKVIELCGNVMRNYCQYCEHRFTALDILEMPGIPYCYVDMCGQVIAPEIFLYGDPLNKDLLTDAVYHIVSSDLFILAGTGLLDYPAAALAHLYHGKRMVLINPEATPLEERADLVIHAPIREVMAGVRVKPKTP